jgi:hypothetical protein
LKEAVISEEQVYGALNSVIPVEILGFTPLDKSI